MATILASPGGHWLKTTLSQPENLEKLKLVRDLMRKSITTALEGRAGSVGGVGGSSGGESPEKSWAVALWLVKTTLEEGKSPRALLSQLLPVLEHTIAVNASANIGFFRNLLKTAASAGATGKEGGDSEDDSPARIRLKLGFWLLKAIKRNSTPPGMAPIGLRTSFGSKSNSSGGEEINPARLQYLCLLLVPLIQDWEWQESDGVESIGGVTPTGGSGGPGSKGTGDSGEKKDRETIQEPGTPKGGSEDAGSNKSPNITSPVGSSGIKAGVGGIQKQVSKSCSTVADSKLQNAFLLQLRDLYLSLLEQAGRRTQDPERDAALAKCAPALTALLRLANAQCPGAVLVGKLSQLLFRTAVETSRKPATGPGGAPPGTVDAWRLLHTLLDSYSADEARVQLILRLASCYAIPTSDASPGGVSAFLGQCILAIAKANAAVFKSTLTSLPDDQRDALQGALRAEVARG